MIRRTAEFLLLISTAGIACSGGGAGPGSGGGAAGGAGGNGGVGDGAGASGAALSGGAGAGDAGGNRGGANAGESDGAAGRGGAAPGGSAGGGSAGRGAAAAGGSAGAAGAICDGSRLPADHPDAARDYDISISAVVTDAVTGLMWQRSVIGNDTQWNSGATYCANLTLGGYSGWRLPDRLELESIADFAVHDPAIDAVTFPDTPATFFLTSTGVFSLGPLASRVSFWTIDFQTGFTVNGMPIYGSVRCVRESSPRLCRSGTRYQPSSSPGVESVLDRTTTLTWEKGFSPQPVDWLDATTYCDSLDGGYRLPGVKELLSLTDVTATVIPVDIDSSAFPGTPAGAFWTSTAVAGTPTSAWAVNFGAANGAATVSTNKSEAAQVRCVR